MPVRASIVLSRRTWFPLTLALVTLAPVAGARAQAPRQEGDEGKKVYQKANCVGCHKWHGEGGGGYGGAALSLRQTQLTREQIVEVVRCGRPGTGMPFHLRGAYTDTGKPCYGLSREELGKEVPPEGAPLLRPSEIEAVADYVETHLKGKGPASLEDCIAFFGEGSRACQGYGPRAVPSSPTGQPEAGQGR